MNMLLPVILFAVGVVLVMKGGDWFVDAASWIARALNIPTFIIGATIVSFATTMPEMIVSVLASLEGKNDMAVGNAIGSVTANTGLIMAVAFLFMTIIAPRKRYMKQCLILLAVTSVLWIGSLSGTIANWSMIVLLILFIINMVINIQDARNEPKSEDVEKPNKSETGKNIFLFLIGAVGIVVGSTLLVDNGSLIATALGVPERVIAVTMVAIGTSLPELVTTLTAIRKKESSLSIGNIVGANIIDVALILPICSLVSGGGFQVSATSLQYDFPACLLISCLALIPLLVREKASKWQGALMLGVYIAYLVISI